MNRKDKKKYEIEKFEELVEMAEDGLIHGIRRVEERDGIGYSTKYIIENTRHINDLRISEGKHLVERIGEGNDSRFYRTGGLESLREDYDDIEKARNYQKSESVDDAEDINLTQLIASKYI